jgi:hypothetical protein
MNTVTARLFFTLVSISLCVVSARAASESSSAPAQNGGMYSTYKTPVASTLFDHAFDTSPETDLSKLIRQLMNVIDRLSRYKIPKDHPNIYRVPHAELEHYVCGTHCSIKAWYKPGDGIFLDESLKPETGIFDRSILLHELVHFLQERSGEYENMDPCNRWFHRELDAYNVQNRYLGVIGHPSRVAFTGDNCGVIKESGAKPGTTQVFGGQKRATDPEH